MCDKMLCSKQNTEIYSVVTVEKQTEHFQSIKIQSSHWEEWRSSICFWRKTSMNLLTGKMPRERDRYRFHFIYFLYCLNFFLIRQGNPYIKRKKILKGPGCVWEMKPMIIFIREILLEWHNIGTVFIFIFSSIYFFLTSFPKTSLNAWIIFKIKKRTQGIHYNKIAF